ncbi:MAG: hypothetical protein ABR555_09980 [Pyrinomonadaceae bacterium]
MFGRQVTVSLKPNSATELISVIENQVLPILRKQKGFRDEVTFVAPERSEAIASSFWDTKEDAEAYNLSGYPEVIKALSHLVNGTPTVKTFDIATSTFHKIAAAAKLS